MQPQLLDFGVDGQVFFNKDIGAGDVGLRLVVVVVADVVLDRVVGKKPFKLAVELGGQRFVVAEHQGRLAGFGNDVGHGEGFAGAGGTQ